MWYSGYVIILYHVYILEFIIDIWYQKCVYFYFNVNINVHKLSNDKTNTCWCFGCLKLLDFYPGSQHPIKIIANELNLKKNDKATIVFVFELVFLNSHCRNCTVLFVFYNATEYEKMGV